MDRAQQLTSTGTEPADLHANYKAAVALPRLTKWDVLLMTSYQKRGTSSTWGHVPQTPYLTWTDVNTGDNVHQCKRCFMSRFTYIPSQLISWHSTILWKLWLEIADTSTLLVCFLLHMIKLLHSLSHSHFSICMTMFGSSHFSLM